MVCLALLNLSHKYSIWNIHICIFTIAHKTQKFNGPAGSKWKIIPLAQKDRAVFVRAAPAGARWPVQGGERIWFLKLLLVFSAVLCKNNEKGGYMDWVVTDRNHPGVRLWMPAAPAGRGSLYPTRSEQR